MQWFKHRLNLNDDLGLSLPLLGLSLMICNVLYFAFVISHSS